MNKIPKWLQYLLVVPVVVKIVVKVTVKVYNIVVKAIKAIKEAADKEI